MRTHSLEMGADDDAPADAVAATSADDGPAATGGSAGRPAAPVADTDRALSGVEEAADDTDAAADEVANLDAVEGGAGEGRVVEDDVTDDPNLSLVEELTVEDVHPKDACRGTEDADEGSLVDAGHDSHDRSTSDSQVPPGAGRGREEAPPGPLVLPHLEVSWPRALPPRLREVCLELPQFRANGLLAALPDLWAAVDVVLARVGPSSLVADSVRYHGSQGWSLAALPRYDTTGRPQWHRSPEPPAPWQRDRRALVTAIVGAVAPREVVDSGDALALLDVLCGQLPMGLDAVCWRLLTHDLLSGVGHGLAAVHEALARTSEESTTSSCYVETAVGSRKAHGHPSTDNEDVAGAWHQPPGPHWMAVFDGVTGNGDGSGLLAARAAFERARQVWPHLSEPGLSGLLKDLASVVASRARTGGAAVVMARVADGKAVVLSAGDCEAWLLRPVREPGPAYLAWRLNPSHTELADSLKVDPDAAGSPSALVCCLDEAFDRAQGFLSDAFPICPGDLLLLASDGATRRDRGRWFGDDLTALAADLAATRRPLAPALAAALVHRAEELGGTDNATALVCSIQPATAPVKGPTPR